MPSEAPATDAPWAPLLDHWFGETRQHPARIASRASWWFGGSGTVDRELGERWEEHAKRAAAGELDDWADDPEGRLALILLLDQLPRHLYRGTPAAFAQDPKAQRLAVDGLVKRMDHGLDPAARAFFYMPLEHAENPRMQALSVAAFSRLALDHPELDVLGAQFLPFAEQHREIIDRFGRFPHRNEILGRETTAEEQAFLDQGGETFGQEG